MFFPNVILPTARRGPSGIEGNRKTKEVRVNSFRCRPCAARHRSNRSVRPSGEPSGGPASRPSVRRLSVRTTACLIHNQTFHQSIHLTLQVCQIDLLTVFDVITLKEKNIFRIFAYLKIAHFSSTFISYLYCCRFFRRTQRRERSRRY